MKLYRCWIIWRQPLVMIIPCFSSLAFLGASLHKLTYFGLTCLIVTVLMSVAYNIKIMVDNAPLPYWYSSAVTAFFVLSLGVNAVTTALIVYRIMTVYNGLRGFNVNSSSYGNGQHNLNLNTLISILIESGLITFAGQLAQSMMYKLNEPAIEAFPLVGDCVVMLFVRLSLFCLPYSHLLFTHREFRQPLSLCVWRWAFLTVIIQQGR